MEGSGSMNGIVPKAAKIATAKHPTSRSLLRPTIVKTLRKLELWVGAKGAPLKHPYVISKGNDAVAYLDFESGEIKIRQTAPYSGSAKIFLESAIEGVDFEFKD